MIRIDAVRQFELPVYRAFAFIADTANSPRFIRAPAPATASSAS